MNEKPSKEAVGLSGGLTMLFALLPIYWMVNMSFKTNEEILSTFVLPRHFTWANYRPSSRTSQVFRATSTA